MNLNKTHMRLALAVALAAGLAVAVPSAQSNMAAAEKYTAFAVDISNTAPRANASTVDITINRWSTDAERDQCAVGPLTDGQAYHERDRQAEGGAGRESCVGREPTNTPPACRIPTLSH